MGVICPKNAYKNRQLKATWLGGRTNPASILLRDNILSPARDQYPSPGQIDEVASLPTGDRETRGRVDRVFADSSRYAMAGIAHRGPGMFAGRGERSPQRHPRDTGPDEPRPEGNPLSPCRTRIYNASKKKHHGHRRGGFD